MARKKVVVLEADNAIRLGFNKKTKKTITHAEGYFLGTKLIPSKMNPGKMDALHIFKGEKSSVGVWGFTSLDQQLAAVPKGIYAYVDYKGKKDLPNGKSKHSVEVEYDDDNYTDVGGLDVQGTEISQEPEANDFAAVDEGTEAMEDESYEASQEPEEEEVAAESVPRPPVQRGNSPSQISQSAIQRAQALAASTRAKLGQRPSGK